MQARNSFKFNSNLMRAVAAKSFWGGKLFLWFEILRQQSCVVFENGLLDLSTALVTRSDTNTAP